MKPDHRDIVKGHCNMAASQMQSIGHALAALATPPKPLGADAYEALIPAAAVAQKAVDEFYRRIMRLQIEHRIDQRNRNNAEDRILLDELDDDDDE